MINKSRCNSKSYQKKKKKKFGKKTGDKKSSVFFFNLYRSRTSKGPLQYWPIRLDIQKGQEYWVNCDRQQFFKPLT